MLFNRTLLKILSRPKTQALAQQLYHSLSPCCSNLLLVNAFDKESTDTPVIWLIPANSCDEAYGEIENARFPFNEDFLLLVPGYRDKACRHSIADLNNIQVLCDAVCAKEQLLLQANMHLLTANLTPTFEHLNFIGVSERFFHMQEEICLFAQSDENILLYGETGTGKELTARAAHYLSERRAGPFIPVNCGALQEDLLLSELFGHSKGAYTGATSSRIGLLEAADGGTLFLDEIDSLPAKGQVALLRFLQEQEIRPVGQHNTKRINVRIVAASNQPLGERVKRGDFREDLLYRLDVLKIELPPLRERESDSLLIAQYFLARLACNTGKQNKVLSRRIMQHIRQRLWHGNVRELENYIRRLFVLTKESLIDDASLPEITNQLQNCGSFQEEKTKVINQFERRYIDQLLTRFSGNISRAAQFADKERRTFTRLMQKHGIDRSSYTG